MGNKIRDERTPWGHTAEHSVPESRSVVRVAPTEGGVYLIPKEKQLRGAELFFAVVFDGSGRIFKIGQTSRILREAKTGGAFEFFPSLPQTEAGGFTDFSPLFY